jgi:23S rRNA (cytosine1962-C5)-methyltransferase
MAFEVVTAAWLEERIIATDPSLLVVDKPSGVPVHGGREALGEDVVTRLGRWLSARGEDPYLGVHHRLDQEASGVLLFTRQKDVNAVVARAFETHAVERVYVAAVTGAARLPASGILEDRLLAKKGEATRVVKSGGQLARARYRVLERRGERALVELRPETGRTHQLRIQLASRGAPIVGDTLYGGSPAPRLLLHAARLGVPELGHSFTREAPWEFAAWLRGDAGLGTPERLASALRDAAWLRAPLAPLTSAHRLVNELGDGLPGIAIDRYGDFAVLAVASEEASARALEIAECVMAWGARGVVRKHRVKADVRRVDPREAAPAEALLGETPPPGLVVDEHGMKLRVELCDGLSTGLFVDQRENRELVRAQAAGARVLNLFSYTGSFSVAAALGGAAHVTTVDVSGKVLEWAKDNFRLNQLEPSEHTFVRADAVEWLARARKRGALFDLVVLDPPTFASVGGRGSFSVPQHYERLVSDVLNVLGPGGRALLVTNHRKTTVEQLRQLARRVAETQQRQLRQLKTLASATDCPAGPDGPLPSKSLWLVLE